MKAKGLVHIHSNYSDGELSLSKIKKKAKEFGMNFVFLADHISKIGGRQKFEDFCRECQSLSEECFLMVPGVEIETLEGYHVLVYNGKIFSGEGIPAQSLFDIFSDEKEVFLVLAHASQVDKKPPLDFMEKINAIEVWNAKYDSRYAPNLKSLNWALENNLIALAGTDAHSLYSLNKLWIEAEINKLEAGEIINSFIKNEFLISNGLLSINFKKPFGFYLSIYFKIVNFLYPLTRKALSFLIGKKSKPPKFLQKLFHKSF
jgi:hypothetical protein